MVKKIWDHFEEYILVSSLVFTVALIFIQVIMRYVMQNSLSWSEELARYVFLWQIWLGASYAVKEHRHLKIEAFLNMLPKKAQKYGELLSLLIWFSFSVFLAYKGTELAHMLAKRGQVSPAMRMPMAYAYASVPAGCALMAIRLISEIISFFKSLKEGVA
jgi:TRAP-type C4-dicarboxylate transport system permease small subunit